jgi:hypothetical protein
MDAASAVVLSPDLYSAEVRLLLFDYGDRQLAPDSQPAETFLDSHTCSCTGRLRGAGSHRRAPKA